MMRKRSAHVVYTSAKDSFITLLNSSKWPNYARNRAEPFAAKPVTKTKTQGLQHVDSTEQYGFHFRNNGKSEATRETLQRPAAMCNVWHPSATLICAVANKSREHRSNNPLPSRNCTRNIKKKDELYRETNDETLTSLSRKEENCTKESSVRETKTSCDAVTSSCIWIARRSV